MSTCTNININGSAPSNIPQNNQQQDDNSFNPIILNTVGQYAIISSNTIFINVKRLRGWEESVTGFGELIKEYSWSKDNSTWSYWEQLTQMNLDELSNRNILPETGFYFRVRYTLSSIGNITISDFKLNVELNSIDSNKGILPPNFLCSGTGNVQGSILANCNGTFNPYLIDPCNSLYQDLVSSVQNMFGLDVVYLRAKPMDDSGDVIFKEWTLYSVENPICTKVLVPDNEFPDPTLQYNPYGIEYEIPFEIHIVKKNFEDIFGPDAAPQSRDIVYFPMIPNRLYEVKSTTPVQDFMLQMTYWKVDLMIYRSKADTYMSQSIEQMLDEITIDSYEAFGKEIDKETKKITKPQQYDRNLGSNLIDPIRKYVNQEMKVLAIPLKNNGTIIAEQYYDLSTVFNPQKNVTAVQYAINSKFKADDNFAFSCWFKNTSAKFNIMEDPVRLTKISDNVIRIQLQSIRKYQIGDLLQVFRQGKLNFYGIINTIHNDSLYDIEISDDVLKFLNSVNLNWINATGWNAKRCFERIFIDCIDKNKGWQLSSIAERFFIFKDNENEIIFNVPEVIGEKWTAVFFNYSALFQQLNISFWEINEGQKTSELNVIFNQTLNIKKSEDKNSEINYTLPASNTMITNIRIYNEIVEIEKQSMILNQNIVQDSNLIVLLDNCLNLNKLSYVGNTK